MKKISKSLMGLVAGALLVTAATLPARAESSSCTFALEPLGNDNCTTGSVHANSSGHFVYISVSPYVHYEVYDTSNGVTVSSGQSGVLGKRKTITGLYARYKLEMHGTFGHGTINNT